MKLKHLMTFESVDQIANQFKIWSFEEDRSIDITDDFLKFERLVALGIVPSIGGLMGMEPPIVIYNGHDQIVYTEKSEHNWWRKWFIPGTSRVERIEYPDKTVTYKYDDRGHTAEHRVDTKGTVAYVKINKEWDSDNRQVWQRDETRDRTGNVSDAFTRWKYNDDDRMIIKEVGNDKDGVRGTTEWEYLPDNEYRTTEYYIGQRTKKTWLTDSSGNQLGEIKHIPI